MKIIQSRLFVPCIITALALSLCTAPAMAALYTGGLSETNGLYLQGWETATLGWTVTSDSSGMWTYSYDLTALPRDISHFILEVTSDPELQLDELKLPSLQYNNGSGWTPWDAVVTVDWWYKSDGESNPGMPSDVYGVKFDLDGLDTTKVKFSFQSLHSPVWGDFYAKDGNDGPVYLYNTTFGQTDPTNGPANGSVNFKVLRPNGLTIDDPGDPGDEVTPELSSGLLLLLGALPVGIAWRRRRR